MEGSSSLFLILTSLNFYCILLLSSRIYIILSKLTKLVSLHWSLDLSKSLTLKQTKFKQEDLFGNCPITKRLWIRIFVYFSIRSVKIAYIFEDTFLVYVNRAMLDTKEQFDYIKKFPMYSWLFTIIQSNYFLTIVYCSFSLVMISYFYFDLSVKVKS